MAVSFENQRSSGIKIINGHDLPVFGARRSRPQRAARGKAFDASGIRNDITSVQAVKSLLGLGVRVYAVDTGTRSVIFHPKLFLSEGKTTARLVIGSANMTFSGLHNNIEAGAILDLDLTNKDDKQFLETTVKTLEGLPTQFPDHVFQIKDAAAADALFDDGRLMDEDVVRAPVVASTLRKGNRNPLRLQIARKISDGRRTQVRIRCSKLDKFLWRDRTFPPNQARCGRR